MKRIIVFVLTVAILFALAGCGGETVSTGTKKVSVNSIEDLQEVIEKDVADTVEGLNTEYDKLVAEIDTYDKYVKNTKKVSDFYNKIKEANMNIGIRMREYSITYTQLVLKTEGKTSDKVDAMEDLYDLVYDDACGDIYDGIYDDLMDDMYDAIYDGVVEDGYDYAPYEKWSDVTEAAYDEWLDVHKDIYDDWSCAHSDIYRFIRDVGSAVSDNDVEKAEAEIADFEEDIAKLKKTESKK